MRAIVTFLFIAVSPLIGMTADLTVGDEVFVKDAPDPQGGSPVVFPFGKTNASPATIDEVDGPRIRLGEFWVRKTDVMTTQEALQHYTERIRKEPTTAAPWSHRGSVWGAIGNLDAAIKDYTEALRLNPTDALTWSNRGKMWARKGELDSSIKDFTEALKLDPKDADSYFSRGNARKRKGELDTAISDFTEVISLNPKDPAPYNNRGNAWRSKGEFDKAIRDFSESIRVTPNDAIPYNNRGNAWKSKGEFDKAVMDFTESIRLDPRFSAPYANIAWLKATCPDDRYRDGKNAIEFATKACGLTAWKSSKTLTTLAAANAETGDFVNAIKWGEKSLDLAPEDERKFAAELLDLYRANMPYRDMPKK